MPCNNTIHEHPMVRKFLKKFPKRGIKAMRCPQNSAKCKERSVKPMDFQKSTWMPPPGSHPTSGFGTRHGLLKFFRHKKRRIVQNDAAKTKISPVDIPTGRDPRANQSPTGALVASCGWPPFFESSLGQHKKQNALPGYGRTFCFLWT